MLGPNYNFRKIEGGKLVVEGGFYKIERRVSKSSKKKRKKKKKRREEKEERKEEKRRKEARVKLQHLHLLVSR